MGDLHLKGRGKMWEPCSSGACTADTDLQMNLREAKAMEQLGQDKR